MKLHLILKSETRLLDKVIYCDPTEKQLDKFILALLESIKILDRKGKDDHRRTKKEI